MINVICFFFSGREMPFTEKKRHSNIQHGIKKIAQFMLLKFEII